MTVERKTLVKLMAALGLLASWQAGAERQAACGEGAYWRPADNPPAALWALADWPLDPERPGAAHSSGACSSEGSDARTAAAPPETNPTSLAAETPIAVVAEATPARDGSETIAKEPALPFAGEAEQVALSDESLDKLRGGFDLGNGLQLNFGFEQVVFVNGQLVTTTALNLQNLAQSVSAQARSEADAARRQADAALQSALATAAAATGAANAAANDARAAGQAATAAANAAANQARGDANAAAGQAAAAGSAGAAAANAAATQAASGLPVPRANAPAPNPATNVGMSSISVQASSETGVRTQSDVVLPSASTPGNVPPTVVSNASTSPNAALTIVQNGAGNLVTTNGLNTGMTTVIQNSVNDQRIQMMTILNAQVNSLQVQRQQMFNSMLREAIVNSIRR